jgi:hypothetical protein
LLPRVQSQQSKINTFLPQKCVLISSLEQSKDYSQPFEPPRTSVSIKETKGILRKRHNLFLAKEKMQA